MIKQPCYFYPQGKCRYGKQCKYSHQGFLQALMIRHAQSQFNKMIHQFPDRQFTGQMAKNTFQLNKDIIDCALSMEGVKQCKLINIPYDYAGKNKQIDVIFVSPLNRTLQTVTQIIKSSQLIVKRIIVLPELTEVLSKVCDFSSSIQQKKRKYPAFDFSQMERFLKNNQELVRMQDWQDALVDQTYYPDILSKQDDGNRYMHILSRIFPTPLENSQHCFQRALSSLQIMKQICLENKYSKIIIVSHNRILKYLDGRFSKGRAQSLQNGEVRRIIF